VFAHDRGKERNEKKNTRDSREGTLLAERGVEAMVLFFL
jgi:hypothetical protein